MEYKDGDACPICGRGRLKVERKVEDFCYNGRVLYVELTVYSCKDCGEAFYDNEEMKDKQEIFKKFLNKDNC